MGAEGVKPVCGLMVFGDSLESIRVSEWSEHKYFRSPSMEDRWGVCVEGAGSPVACSGGIWNSRRSRGTATEGAGELLCSSYARLVRKDCVVAVNLGVVVINEVLRNCRSQFSFTRGAAVPFSDSQSCRLVWLQMGFERLSFMRGCYPCGRFASHKQLSGIAAMLLFCSNCRVFRFGS
ncbi:hypothetical protein L6452_19821 [Arctium lappa]|uniref:Uncharacterized protein n=1 Tax=Arctium lappa TaxID=4217 RepID=A0ACB9BAY2_ARCLA|nr:hypothetical protein L6452_19821 [Arctium lappa]